MHKLFARVLSQKDLSRAGDLFSIPDADIVDDLSEALDLIQAISSSPDYLTSHNNQAVVEICITRVTTAIRDTITIEQHALALVSLWRSCLQHNLKPLTRDEDPPHAKIASDIMSCLFMQNYSKYSLMKIVLPVAVQFLKHDNREISRNMSSYLALAAIDNASLLALHCDEIIQSIIRGNRSLARILPQVYLEEPGPIDANINELLYIMPRCDDVEKTHLLQLVSLVAKQNPKLLLGHVPLLVKCLTIPNSSQTVLAALVDVVSIDARPFASCLSDLEDAISRQPSLLSMALKIFGAVGRLNQVNGKECMAFLVEQLGAIDQTSLPAVLIEIKSIADQHSGLLGTHIAEISLQGESPSMAARMIIQQLQEDITYRSEQLSDNVIPDEQRRSVPLSLSPPTPSKSKSMSEMHRMGTEPERRMHYRKGKASNRGSVDHLLSSVQKLTTSASSAALMPSEKPGSPKDLESIKQSKFRSQSHSEAVQLSESRTSLPAAVSTLSKTKGRTPASSSSSQKSDIQRRINNKEGGAGSSKGNLHQEETSRPSSVINGGTNSRLVGNGQNGGSSGIHAQEGSQLGQEGGDSDLTGARTTPKEGTKPVPLEGVKAGVEGMRGMTSLEGARASSALRSAGGNRDSSLQQYLSKRQKEIISYMDSIKKRIPVPDECTVREISGRNPVGRLDFYCQRKGRNCLYSASPFAVETKEIQPWIHLKFLQLQATSPTPVSLDDTAVQSLRKNWERQKTVGGTMTFLKLITQNFPPSKDQQALMDVLNKGSFYDLFMYNPQHFIWNCFICNNPSKFDLLAGGRPLIEGQLKEKKVRFKLFRRWRTRYFTLAGEQLYTKSNSQSKPTLPIELSKVQGVKTVHGGRRHERSIPKAFEIFTADKTYIFKTKDGKGAEQWVQCLTLAIRKASRKGSSNDGGEGGGVASGDSALPEADSR